MSNIYEEDEPFSDMPVEAQTVYDENGRATIPQNNYVPPLQTVATSPRSIQRQQVIQQSNDAIAELNKEQEREQEESADEDEENYKEALNDASLRLEQGSLYKLIMNHDLFAGSDADPKAIKNVQREIRKFAKEQMELMLGMRQTASTRPPLVNEGEQIEFPFNALEVEILKQLASAATKGQSEKADKYIAPKQHKLNPIDCSETKKTSKPLAIKPDKPVYRASRIYGTDSDVILKEMAAKEGVSVEWLRQGVERELSEQGQLSNKPIREMTPDELARRNEIVSQRRGVQVRSSGGYPTLSPEQIAQHNETRAVTTSNNPLWNQLIDIVKKLPTNKS